MPEEPYRTIAAMRFEPREDGEPDGYVRYLLSIYTRLELEAFL